MSTHGCLSCSYCCKCHLCYGQCEQSKAELLKLPYQVTHQNERHAELLRAIKLLVEVPSDYDYLAVPTELANLRRAVKLLAEGLLGPQPVSYWTGRHLD